MPGVVGIVAATGGGGGPFGRGAGGSPVGKENRLT